MPPKLDNIILSYSESNTFCLDCPRFRVDFRNGGHVNYECLGSCAVPGEQHHLVPTQRFQDLVREFHDAGFFAVPRTDPSRMVADATVVRLTYRDERRIHEVVDVERHIPRVTQLENRMKTATEVDRYLKPSLILYRRLVDSGWDVNTLGPDHQNALFSAVIFRDLESMRFLLQHGSKVTDQTLEFAALSENIEILRLIVRAAQIKLTGERGQAILGQAARSRQTDLVQFLLDSGADVNSRGPGEGLTPLASAVNNGAFENARLLLRKGANADARDHSGRTALWYAAVSENSGLITLLLEHGADVNARDNAGRTALMHAADLCFTWDIRALLDAGADPRVQDKRGRTALEPQPASVGDPKCATGRKMIEDAVRFRPAQQR
ncbi:MAG TPA: ankyrin repeat domain-containing protein [Candidatus Acidoferrum sp.]|nr:ankyrin repeat domain-containing protein [Candidatus Acidoferrum sp.]